MSSIRYFVAAFGEKHGARYPVDGGCYPVPSCYEAPQMISKGDLVLLCCWGGHKGLWNGAAWGVGKVTHKKHCVKGNRIYIYYDHQPLDEPIVGTDIEACLKAEERGKFKAPHLKPCFLFEITPDSFACVLPSKPPS